MVNGGSWMYYRKKKRRHMYVAIDKVDWLAGCWITNVKYPSIKGESIHRTYAPGQGPVVRHLCCNNRCTNPLHMIRGSQQENMDDEVRKRDVCSGNTGELSDYWYYRIWFKGRILNMLRKDNREDRDYNEAVSNASILMSKFKSDRYITVMEDKYGKEETVL